MLGTVIRSPRRRAAEKRTDGVLKALWALEQTTNLSLLLGKLSLRV
jgi:hypothetical protein